MDWKAGMTIVLAFESHAFIPMAHWGLSVYPLITGKLFTRVAKLIASPFSPSEAIPHLPTCNTTCAYSICINRSK